MKKKGSALIYVLIIMIPVMLVSLSIVEIADIDFHMGDNVINSRQALYNAEAGISYGLKKLQLNNYSESFGGYNAQKYIIFDNNLTASNSQSYSETFISYFGGIFTIKSKGYYRGFVRYKTLEINKNLLPENN